MKIKYTTGLPSRSSPRLPDPLVFIDLTSSSSSESTDVAPPRHHVLGALSPPQSTSPDIAAPNSPQPATAASPVHVEPLIPEVDPDVPSLERIFPRGDVINTEVEEHLVAFPALSGPRSNLVAYPSANNPATMDLDAACFMMLTKDLPELFGIMGRPANRKVKVKDLVRFDHWLHVISDPIVVKIYAGETV